MARGGIFFDGEGKPTDLAFAVFTIAVMALLWISYKP